MPVRGMQADDPAALPKNLAGLSDQAGQRPGPADEDLSGRLAVVAGAVSVLARRVETLGTVTVTAAERLKALEQAREFVADLLTRPASEADRISNELAVARYLTGE